MKPLLTFITNNTNSISIIFLAIAGIWSFIKFQEYLKDKRFSRYHKLIEELVDEKCHKDNQLKLDRQIAIIFELRNFPNYFPVSKRIFNGLLEIWKDKRMIQELTLGISYMSKNQICRFFHKD